MGDAPLPLIPRDRQATTVDTTVMDTAPATDAPLPLILRDRQATTVDTMVMDTDMGTATATDAPLLLIRRDRLATTVDTTPDMVVTATDILTTKSDFLLPLMTFPMVRLSKFCGICFLLSEIQRKLQLLK